MYPLALQSGARHRREPSTRQRIRAAVATLMALALIAGFGVFGGTLLGGQTGQARLLAALDDHVNLAMAGWALCAVPAAGFFGLMMPTRSRVVRALSFLLLIAGGAALVVMSKPRGVDGVAWRAALGRHGADAAAFLAGMEKSSYTLAAVLLLWAVVASIAAGSARRQCIDDLWAAVRRSALWVAPLALTASLAAAVLAA